MATDAIATYKLKLSKAEMANQDLIFWYIVQFTDIAVKQFKYGNMPDYMPIDIIERNLFNEGKSLFFEDGSVGYLCLPTTAFSKYNEYGMPIEYQAIGFNGKTWKRSIADSVLMKNTPAMAPCLPIIYEFCKELANIRQAMKVNINSTKTPFVFSGNKEELLSLKNVYKKISDNEPITYVESGIMDKLNALNTQAPFVADKLDALYTSTLGRALTYLGINNTETEKKERLTNEEVNGNNEFISANLKVRLDARRDAVEKINKMFGLNITVEINEEYDKELAEFMKVMQGGEETDVTGDN